MGRVMAARMDKEEDGSHFVRLQVAITDPVAIQKVLDKRYLTGSVGGRAGKALCSISGDDLAKIDESGKPRLSRYKRGQVYKGKLAYVDMQDISFKEYSFVNQPADGKSSIRAVSSGDNGSLATTDNQWVAKSSAFVLHMDNEDIVSVEENESILKSLKKKESKPLYLHLKGAFLTAVAVQESENYNYKDNSLLSNENQNDDSYQENSNMKDNVKDDDILAAVEDLSEDLSAIAAAKKPEQAEEQTSDTEEKEEIVEEKNEEEVSEEVVEEAKVEEQMDSEAAVAVQKVLNEMIVLGFAAQRAHWNIVGVDFQEYHALFGSIYEDVFDAIDHVAEEIRKMDTMVANLTNMIMSAGFKDDIDSSDARALAEDVLNKNMMLNETVLAAFAACSAANAQGTADLMAARDGMHKKWSWQLKSSLGMEAGEAAEESWKDYAKKSEEVEESKDEPSQEMVESKEASASEENQEVEDSKAELTGSDVASEQQADDSNERIQSLEEENAKLKKALHRTLAERVVDTKIAAGVESEEQREELIEEHLVRSASSLADSLRDLAKMPAVKTSKAPMLEMDSEVEVMEEENTITLDGEAKEEVKEDKVKTPEQLFVDALMGRRKL
jgi:starvation-inducible DNA-binding protein